MTELRTFFKEQDEEKEVCVSVRELLQGDKIEYNFLFNYYFYNMLYNLKHDEKAEVEVKKCLMYLIAKENNLQNLMGVLNNSYQICSMHDSEFIIRILCGQKTNLFTLDSDAQKLGAALTIFTRKYDKTKLNYLKETLFLIQNMI